MTDIRTKWTGAQGDYAVVSGSLLGDDALGTAVLISLFTDARARADDILPDVRSTDRRGWWGDIFEPDDGVSAVGSRLWLLEREKQTSETLTRAENYAREALDWMIDDGIATSVSVATEWLKQGTMGIRIDITRPDLTSLSWRYDWAWQERQNSAT